VKQGGTTASPQGNMWPTMLTKVSFETNALVAHYYMHDPSVRLYGLEL